MQFRCLLESFQYNIDTEITIYVIAGSEDGYEDIKSEFKLNWINEEHGFGAALSDLMIDTYGENILFGVDDQIITGHVNLKEADRLLKSDPSVFNYSFRTGTNIDGYTEVLSDSEACNKFSVKYRWRGKPSHWGYPLSLDFLMYRADDLVQVMNSEYRVPADFEAYSYQYFLRNYSREYMAFSNRTSVAYCQDLNKVQLNHGAPCYGNETHDPAYLLEEYKNGKRLDWKSAQGFEHSDPFCRGALWKMV